jgi:hypothetical protein
VIHYEACVGSYAQCPSRVKMLRDLFNVWFFESMVNILPTWGISVRHELLKLLVSCVWTSISTRTHARAREGVFESFRTGRLKQELQMLQLSATRCSCIAIVWVSLLSFTVITICVASQRVIPKVSVHIVFDSVRKLLDTLSYLNSSAGIT